MRIRILLLGKVVRICSNWPSKTLHGSIVSLYGFVVSLHDSIVSLHSSLLLTAMRIRIQLFTLKSIRLPKNDADPDGLKCVPTRNHALCESGPRLDP
jgi:hypothetical protein